MAKSYSQFTLEEIKSLGIRLVQQRIFEDEITDIKPSELLQSVLDINLKMRTGTEKAKSELLVTPILNEITVRNNNEFIYFSGYSFDVDKSRGLKGIVDYIISNDPIAIAIESPVFCIVEAKNDNLDLGVPQCVAEMFAAQIFNNQNNKPLPAIFGAVTYGFGWQFLKLENKFCVRDTEIYYLNNLPKLLGVLQYIVDFHKK
jgi:hypothetical protein